MKKTKLEKGITLIALILTIIVLLIIAVVTIGAIKDSNIIGHAQNAANDYTVAQEKEQIGLAYSEYKIGKYAGSKDTFETIFANSEIEGTVSGNDENGYVIVVDDRIYAISPDGAITQESTIPWDGTTKTAVVESENNTYLISNAAELAWFAEQVNSGNLFEGKTVKLTNDINLANKEWTPIGAITSTGAYNFFGGTTGATFDGNGYAIKNIKVTNCSLLAVGLFTAIQQGTIQNLGIESGIIEGLGAESVDNAATMCSQLGGILGMAMGDVEIIGCYNNGVNLKYATEARYGIGGIVSGNMGNLTITNCYNNATSLDEFEFGGILYTNISGTVTISNCYNIGKVNNGNGIYFTNNEGTTVEVTNCYTVDSSSEDNLTSVTGITIATKEEIQEMINNINTEDETTNNENNTMVNEL